MIVVDTHVLIWAVQGDRRLGSVAARAIEGNGRERRIGVSAITPWEIARLTERGRLRLDRDVAEWIDAVLGLPAFRLLPIEPTIAVGSVRLPGAFTTDPADRFIVATARHHGAPLLTADRAILSYGAAGHARTMDARR
ncbi:type II toxin-antitoxin system VapC family toxin [Candidatus Palauibacter sp.]|uniref:type II toxin-antitoxin system VapC family toxin n=1 Tax=Candidatus Palauibacter sp. TaxID=3101350 RepID=UPI003B02DB96